MICSSFSFSLFWASFNCCCTCCTFTCKVCFSSASVCHFWIILLSSPCRPAICSLLLLAKPRSFNKSELKLFSLACRPTLISFSFVSAFSVSINCFFILTIGS
uniref:Secreted protein n=1 Tax=Panstrongylus lignarius TaxID=156445 RepID=A0A224XQL1_9HEMI